MDLFLDASDFDMLADFTDPSDVDPSFAPMPRERANTWHGRPQDIPKDDDSAHASPSFADDSVDDTASTSAVRDHVQGSAHTAIRKATARRNAWGNMSYADLIAKAIESSPDKRLTLSEIYGWLVENVPFFKDKGETNSSAGWKNSIRHNLSLHNRFMRVQNEGAGKSSWWMVNPDNRTVKAPRRRAATMDNSKALNQKRGRQRRSEPANPISSTTNPSSTSGGDLDGSLQSFFTRSPEFRGRVSSNASSIGRLSPIPATFEVDMDPATSIAPSGAMFASWNNPATTTADSLSESLAGILMDDLQKSPDLAMTSALELPSALKAKPIFLQAGSSVNFPGDFFNHGQYPPPLHHGPRGVFGTSQPKTEVFTIQSLAGMGAAAGSNMSRVSTLCVGGNMSGNGGVSMSGGLQMNARQQLYKTPSVNDIQLQVVTTPGQLFSGALAFAAAPQQQPGFSAAVSPSQTQPGVTSSVQWPGQQEWPSIQQNFPDQSAPQWPKPELENAAEAEAEPQTRQRSFTFSSGKLDQNTLRQLLAAKPCLRTDIQKLLQMKRQQLYAAEQLKSNAVTPQVAPSPRPPGSPVPLHSHHSMLEQLLTGSMAERLSKPADVPFREETKMDEAPSAFPSDLTALANDLPNPPPSDLPNDIDLSYLNTESTTDIECNIDQIIQHELTFGDELDFSFDPVSPNWGNNVGSSGDSLTNFLSY